MDATRQLQAARKFVEHWTFRRGSEKGEDQQFWNALLGSVLGMDDVVSRVQYQVPVRMKDTTKFLDAWIPETRVLVEHKSRGIDLDAPQSGHNGLTPYEQALEYDNARPFDEKARWIVTCNFDEFRIYDRAKPLASPLTLKLRNLPKEAYRLAFLVDPKEKAVDRELEISVQAGRIVGEIYDALLKQYNSTPISSDGFTNVSPGGNSENAAALAETSDKSELDNNLAALNRLCVRLVFCLYAEDAGIFPKDCLRRLVEATPIQYLRGQLQRLFQTLDTPLAKRDPYLEPELAIFPYTNGGLFRLGGPRFVAAAAATKPVPPNVDGIPPLTEEIRRLLVGASQFDWREITPTIFGALFESTLNPITRRAGGMVYTAVVNIHKVIDPLFLDDLTRRVNVAIAKGERRALFALQDEMASLTFLDPACGSGNFLTETYICLRRLENRIIAALQKGQGELWLDDGADLRVGPDDGGRAALCRGRGPDEAGPSHVTVKVSIAQFHGIEINDFAVSVAKTALWIAEAQMLRETAEILHREPDYLPLKDYDNIVEGNALRIDWQSILNAECRMQNAECGVSDNSAFCIQHSAFSFIIGNPPFSGARWMGKEQKEDMLAVFGRDWQGVGDLDYVTAWYKKAADYMRAQGPGVGDQGALTTSNWPLATKCAFVSTNSICQGGAVTNLWKPLFAHGLEIDFAWRTFRWDNEASEKAHVHCVIIGFHCRGAGGSGGAGGSPAELPRQRAILAGEPPAPRQIFDGDAAIPAAHINGYLMDAPDIWIESRAKPLCDVPEIGMGNQPIDGGNYLFTREEVDSFLKSEPQAAPFFHPWYGADEFLNGMERFCLWLGDCPPAELFKMPECLKRIQAVRNLRLASKRASTRKLADKPTRFQTENFPKDHYIVIPEVSSERRRYVPMGYLSPDVICSNKLRLMPDATPYHFGVLNSIVHNAWVRAVCGRLETRYDYSINIVYNNFPWPENPVNPVNPVQKHAADSAPLRLCVEEISATAQGILDARAKYPGATLAQMYGEKMYLFPELVAAHEANDRAVLAAYGLKPDTPEPEIVAHLFRLYAEAVAREKDGKGQ